MQASHVITVSIGRPYGEVYEFLADPLNFGRWASLPNSTMDPLGGSDWLVDLPRGRRVIRFAPRNTFGVLDYQVFEKGEDGGPITPVRVVPNGGGTELIFVWFRHDGVSDDMFRSEVEWITSDLQRLKSLVEGG